MFYLLVAASSIPAKGEIINIMEIEKDITHNQAIEAPQKPTDITAALERVIQHVGEMGTYQKLLFVAMLPFGFAWAFVYFGQMFITATPEHWCLVPELDGLSVELRRNLSIPIDQQGYYDQCSMFDANWTQVLETLLPPDPNTATVPCQNGWEWAFDDIPYSTIVNEREWVCSRATFAPLGQTVFFVGSMCGGIICGILADKFGRLPILILANMFGFVGGIATIFTTSLWDFLVCRFITGLSCDSLFILIYILVLEYMGTSHRTWVGNLSIAFYFGTGCVILPWIALWISDWKLFVLVTSLPMLIALVTPFLVPESTRWLVSKGKIEKAVSILRRFEKINKTKVPKEVMDDFIFIAKMTKEPEENALQLVKVPSLRVILIYLVISFMAVVVVFDSLVRLSESLGLDFFVTFTMTSATEIPSFILLVFVMDRFGRRNLVFVPMMLAGVLSFIAAFVPLGIPSVSLAVVARFFTNMAYGASLQWTLELLPTAVRATGASFVHLSACAVVIFSPFIVYSERAWTGLPLIIMALVSIIGAGVSLLLPETVGRPMPQTWDDMEELAKTRPCLRKDSKSTQVSAPQGLS